MAIFERQLHDFSIECVVEVKVELYHFHSPQCCNVPGLPHWLMISLSCLLPGFNLQLCLIGQAKMKSLPHLRGSSFILADAEVAH